jgi:ketosteroid isomerase-like protein
MAACSTSEKYSSGTYHYTIDDKPLYDTIAKLDSIFFDAYNNCSSMLDKYASFYAEDLEFYHDKGGFSSSKKDMVDATQRNICGKITRQLIKGSIEVYPIKDYGAIETGLHSFNNNQEKQTGPATVGRFTIFWRKTNEGWKIAKVISLH